MLWLFLFFKGRIMHQRRANRKDCPETDGIEVELQLMKLEKNRNTLWVCNGLNYFDKFLPLCLNSTNQVFSWSKGELNSFYLKVSIFFHSTTSRIDLYGAHVPLLVEYRFLCTLHFIQSFLCQSWTSHPHKYQSFSHCNGWSDLLFLTSH